ncbi:MAG: hypothetical protein RPU61_04750 [Candidatus Sedimenticola sp. (ex Thyasira tokunagai)]
MLFEDKPRTYEGPKTYLEGEFDYLDRSARQEAEKVREFLNTWFSRFSENDADELFSRIKSRDKRVFESAIFEIVLFAIISNLGGSLQIHPDLDNGSNKHPDFLVTTAGGEEFYLEAVLASEFSAAELAAEKRKNVVLEAIEKIESPNFFIGIHADGDPETPPSGKALRKELSSWLIALDPDEVAETVELESFRKTHKMEWNHDGWDIEFEAIPIKPERRGKGQRVIGVMSGGARWINGWEPIRDAICAKGNRYGELSKPLIVAVNIDAFSLDRIDEMQALFGQEEYIFNRGSNEAQPQMRRAANGAWSGPNGPKYTRVSGAWLFGGMNPWNIPSRKNTLYFNPWARLPVSDELTRINHAVAAAEKMQWVEGVPLWEILGLEESWPEQC